MATTVVIPSSIAVTGPIQIVGGGSATGGGSFSTSSSQYAVASMSGAGSITVNGNNFSNNPASASYSIYIGPSSSVAIGFGVAVSWVIFGNL